MIIIDNLYYIDKVIESDYTYSFKDFWFGTLPNGGGAITYIYKNSKQEFNYEVLQKNY